MLNPGNRRCKYKCQQNELSNNEWLNNGSFLYQEQSTHNTVQRHSWGNIFLTISLRFWWWSGLMVNRSLRQSTGGIMLTRGGIRQIISGLRQITGGLGEITWGVRQITCRVRQITGGLRQITRKLCQNYKNQTNKRLLTSMGMASSEVTLLPPNLKNYQG